MKPEFSKIDRFQTASAADTRYLLISINGRVFAIPSVYVLEITPSIKPTKLPFVPHYIAGLVNVKGSVIPLLDLSSYVDPDQLPGKKITSQQHQVFVIILSGNTHFSLAVDVAIDEISSIDTRVSLYPADSMPGDCQHVLVSGEIEWAGEKIFILEIDQFNNIIHASEDKRDGGGLLGKLQHQQVHEDEISLLVFHTLGEHFGFVLDDIVEVIEIDNLVPIPGAPDCVQGLAMIRDEALLVLSFPALLGRPAPGENSHKILVVIERETSLYGIDISSMVHINRFLKSSFRKSHNEQSQFGNVLIDDQNQVTIFVKNDELIPAELHNKIKELAPNTSGKKTEVINYKRILHISINGLSYAFPLDYVRMVSTHNTLSRVSDSSKNVAGIIEIEGRIISVLDTGHRLGFVDLENTFPQYVIIGDDSAEWAVAVTVINQIIDIPEMDIEHIESNDLKHLSGIAHYQGQLIPVVDVRELYPHEH